MQGFGKILSGAAFSLLAASLHAQVVSGVVASVSPPPPPPPPVLVGGVLGGSGTLGIPMEAVRNQPYSLVETTTRVQTLADGTHISNVTERHSMRDAEGRQRTESGTLKDGTFEPFLISLYDPVARTSTSILPHGKTANVDDLPEPKPRTPEQEARSAEARARAAAYRKDHPNPNEETLPPQTIAGVYAEGVRRTVVIPVGQMGNDREIRVVTETWTSPDLNIVLSQTTDDPRTGKTTRVVTQLSRTDPDPALFTIPPGYKVIDPKAEVLP